MGLFPKDRNLAASPDRVELPVRASDFRVRAEELNVRLDAFLLRFLTWRSRTSLQDLIKDGYVSVRPAHPEREGSLAVERRVARRLRHGALVVVRIPEELRLPAVTADPGELVVLFEDEDVLAVNKPPLLPVHPSGRHLSGTLIQMIHAVYGAENEGPVPIRLCHRLDRETSGVVLCGKNRAAHRKLMLQFERRQIEKEYLALVHGTPSKDEGMIDMPLGPALASQVHLRIAVTTDGADSRTRWRLRESRGAFSLLSCYPETGRQHQIRVHLAAIGHPIVGDKLYGEDEETFLRDVAGTLDEADRERLVLPRHALHNHRIRFRSPRKGEMVEVESPLAADLEQFFDGVD